MSWDSLALALERDRGKDDTGGNQEVRSAN